MTHLGRDFSSYQGDLTDADCAGIDFAYVKASEGGEYKNPLAPQQVAKLRSHGVLVGYYHFFTNEPVGDQLQNFHMMAQALGVSSLPCALDSESLDPAGFPDLASKMMDFATGVEAWTNWVPHPKSLLYVNVSFYDQLPGFPWGRWVWLADPNPGAPHRRCLVLQGAPRPVSAADAKVIDPDTFVGSDADWALFTGQPATPAPAPTTTVSVPVPENIYDVELTLTPGLDPQGNGWYVVPQIPDVTKVEGITWIGNDPASGQPYAKVPTGWYVDPAKGAIVVTGGLPGGEYACIIHVKQ